MSGLESNKIDAYDLIEEYLERLRNGSHPTIEEYTERYPELAEQILDLFPAMALMEDVSLECYLDSASRDDVEEVASAGGGDFRVIREIGRGAMGIVYEAVQISLGRRVALKALFQEHVRDRGKTQRFEREAKAAARLHHTNIVPVFGVGTRGTIPFYVMQYIEGVGLNELIAELNRMRVTGRGPIEIRRALDSLKNAEETESNEPKDVSRPIVEEAFSDPERSISASEPIKEEKAFIAETTIFENPKIFHSTSRLFASRPAADAPTETFVVGSSVATIAPGSIGSKPERTIASSYWKEVARIGAQAAEAIDYAHRHKVLHRDIKPSNLLLDEQGTVWVTDFGLAKIDDDLDLTGSGDVVGTIRYLPPEAFEGKHDETGDVYSLGITLYEMLALRPAYGDSDRRALIKRVTTEAPPPIAKARPGIPRDLATIVGKAIEREPKHRYASAQKLADDLNRFINDESIEARRASIAERFYRWARRNPAISASLAVIFLLLATAAVVATIAATRFGRLADERGRLVERERKLAGEKEAERIKAQRAGDDAERARRIAEHERQRSLRELYFARFNLIGSSLASPRGDNQLDLLLRDWRGLNVESDPRAWEWYYFHTLLDQAAIEARSHAKEILTIAWSRDGRTIASAGKDASIRLINSASGATTRVVAAPDETKTIAWDPARNRFASGHRDGTVRFWDGKTAALLRTLRAFELEVDEIAWDADGTRIAAVGWDSKIKIWDTSDGSLVATIHGDSEAYLSIAFSPDGSRLCAAGTDGSTTCWDAKTYERVFRQYDDPALTRRIRYSPDGTRIAIASTDRGITIRDAAKGTLIARSSWSFHTLNTMAWSPDGKTLATGGRDRTVGLWDPDRLVKRFALRGFLDEIKSIAWSPDGSRIAAATGGENAVVRIAPVDRPADAFVVPEAHQKTIRMIRFDASGKQFATASNDGSVKIWNAETLKNTRTFHVDRNIIASVCFHPDGESIACGDFLGAIRIWNVKTGSEIATFPGGGREARSIAFNRAGSKLAVGAEDGKVRVWDVASRRLEREFAGFGFDWSPSGDRIAIGELYRINIADAATGRSIVSWPYGGQFNRIVVWSPDGRMIATRSFNIVDVWNPETGSSLYSLIGHNENATAIAWSPDGKRLATASQDFAVRLWDTTSGSMTLTLREHTASVESVAWSPDGTKLVSAGDDLSIVIRDATAGYLFENAPQLLPVLERKIAANPADRPAILARGLALAHAERWNEAAAMIDQAYAESTEAKTNPRCLITGWWSVKNNPLDRHADLHDPFADSPRSLQAASVRPERPVWYRSACDSTGFVPLAPDPPRLYARLYSNQNQRISLILDGPIAASIAVDGKEFDRSRKRHLLEVRRGWTTIVARVDSPERYASEFARPGAGIFVRASNDVGEIAAALAEAGTLDEAIELTNQSSSDASNSIERDRRVARLVEAKIPVVKSSGGDSNEIQELERRLASVYEKIIASNESNDVDAIDYARFLLSRNRNQETSGSTVTDASKPSNRIAFALKSIEGRETTRGVGGWTALGAAKLHSNDPQAAIRALEKAASLDLGSQINTYVLLSLAYHAVGRHDDERSALDRAREGFDRAAPEIWYDRETIEAFTNEINERPAFGAYFARGVALARSGRIGPARADFEKALALDPSDPETRMRIEQCESNIIKSWNFDFETEGWTARGDCVLSTRRGALKAESWGKDPMMFARVDAPPGRVDVLIRARCSAPIPVQVFWNSKSHPVLDELRSRRSNFDASGESWKDYVITIEPEEPLAGLRIDPGESPGSVEIAAISLRVHPK